MPKNEMCFVNLSALCWADVQEEYYWTCFKKLSILVGEANF